MNGQSKEAAVVIPLDGSRTAACAFGCAEAVTQMLGGVLHVLHVNNSLLPEDKLLQLLNIGEAHVGGINYHQISGDVAKGILELADEIDADMIVMSSHGKTHNLELIAGSVTVEVIQHTSIPVMVIRPGKTQLPAHDWRPARMLVPHNGSPVAASEVNQVFDLAGAMGVDIDVVHIAVAGSRPPAEVGAYTSPRYLDRPYYDWSGWADEFMRRFAGHKSKARVRLIHQQGDTVGVTLDFAHENQEDLIALVWQGDLAGEQAATVKGILMHAEVPVLLKKVKNLL